MTPNDLNVGLKVHYSPGFGPTENGIVKSWNLERAWVVYKCDNQWHRFAEFCGAPTSLEDLKFGWKETP